MGLDTRLAYVNHYLLARAWYVAQVLQIPGVCIRQIRTAITCFIWKAPFQIKHVIAYATLRRPKLEGGWGLTDVEVKSRAILYYRMTEQGGMVGTIMADWIAKWGLVEGLGNPPDVRRIPAHLGYLRQYAMDKAYVCRRGDWETMPAYRRRIRTTMEELLCDTVDPPLMRVVRLWPSTNWRRVWRNIQALPGRESLKIRWYQAVPTNVRLRRINRPTTENCKLCGRLHFSSQDCGVWGRSRGVAMDKSEDCGNSEDGC
jgi:hypothetical protein